MTTWRRVFIIGFVCSLGLTSPAFSQDGSVSTQGVSVTTSQTAVFAAFLSDIPDAGVTTAISVGNVLTPAFSNAFQSTPRGGGDTEGTLEFFLYNQDGSLITFDTGTDPTVGSGLNEDGTLGPGQTWTVLMREILTAAGMGPDESFSGYGTLVANFDAVVGTYNVTIFGLGFTQNFEFLSPVDRSVFGGAPYQDGTFLPPPQKSWNDSSSQ